MAASPLDDLCSLCETLCLPTDAGNDDFRENNLATEADRRSLRGDYGGVTLAANVLEALRAIAETFDTYGFEHVAVSFNGGKDCNVMLHLVYLHVCKRYGVERMRALRCLTWRQTDAFAEVAENMALCERVYSLTVDCFDGSFKDGLQVAIDRFSVKAIIMGQRGTDPYAPLDIFAPTSPGWPPMMRVNPVLRWSYADVWLFTRVERVPICDLYFVGFTSLGARDKTVPNPALLVRADGAKDAFLPAWKLADETLERAGRL
jgi:FAD synthetase